MMKTDESRDGDFVVIDLEDGDVETFNRSTKVLRLNAELVISG